MAEESLLGGGEPAPEGQSVPSSDVTTTEGQQGEAPVWHNQIKKEERSQLGEFLNGFQDVTDLATQSKTMLDQYNALKEKAIVIPDENSSEEERQAYREKMGYPSDTKAYEPTLNEVQKALTESGLSEALVTQTVSQFANLAMENGITTKQLEAMMSATKTMNEAHKADIEKQVEGFKAENQKQLEAEWKDDYKTNLTQVQRLVKEAGGEEFLKVLNESGYANDARLIVPLFNLSKRISEPTLDEGTVFGGKEKEGFSFPNTKYPHLS